MPACACIRSAAPQTVYSQVEPSAVDAPPALRAASARFAEALDSLDAALRLLSAAGQWDSPCRQQYLRENNLIHDLMRFATRQRHADARNAEAEQGPRRPWNPTAILLPVLIVGPLAMAFVILASQSKVTSSSALRTRVGQESALGGSLLILFVIVTTTIELIIN